MSNVNLPIDLSANSKIVQDTMKQAGIEPGKNGGQPVPVGTSKKIVTPKVTPAPEPLKDKVYKVKITVQQEARLTREAYAQKLTNTEHLQNIINDKLNTGIGAPFVNGAGWMDAKKVKGPTNNFGYTPNGDK